MVLEQSMTYFLSIMLWDVEHIIRISKNTPGILQHMPNKFTINAAITGIGESVIAGFSIFIFPWDFLDSRQSHPNDVDFNG